MSRKLIFVYNANSGFKNVAKDTLRKIMSPDTYRCSICAITYGVLSERKEWKAFREKSELEMEFLHTDEFKKQYASKFGHKFTFPIVLEQNAGELQVFLTTQKLDELGSVQELIDLVQTYS